MKTLLRGTVALWMAAACATASARQWAVIDGEVVGHANPNRFSVVIVAIDGKADFEAPTVKTITPGFHYVQIASTRQDRRGQVVYVPYAFTAEPCTRYEMYAEYESSLDRSPWQLVITKGSKPLGGCKPAKFADATAVAPAAPGPQQASDTP
jgi:hypothetical protein